MIVDKEYCMSSFLMFRCIADKNKQFASGETRKQLNIPKNRYMIKSSNDIDNTIKEILKNNIDDKTGIMLSGGIDSAILATYVPEGTKAYTLKCIADGAVDETIRAKEFSDKCKLDHKIVEIYWEDYINLTPEIVNHKKAPVHSIEIQIYKAALQAKKDGINKLIFGESADAIFGGQDGLMSKDWTFDDFVKRYTYVMPNKVLKDPILITEPYERYRKGKYIDFYAFVSEFFYTESISSYLNVCSLAGVEFIAPFTNMKLDIPLDLKRIRSGDSKYLVRELFEKLYPGHEMGKKTPMPRPMGQWLANWDGPQRDEFIPGCIKNLDGDQKWLVYVLEWFLNLINE